MASSLSQIEQLFSTVLHYSDSLLQNNRELDSLSDQEKLQLYEDLIRPTMDGLRAANQSISALDLQENQGLYEIIETATNAANEINDKIEQAQQHILLAEAVDSAATSRAPLSQLPPAPRSQNLRDEQEENFQVTQYRDLYKKQTRDFSPENFKENFESILAFYMSVEGKAYFSPSAHQEFTQFMQNIKTDLEGCVQKQKEIEAAALAHIENLNTGAANQNTEHAALINFKTALEQNQAGMIDAAFKGLTDEQKEDVRDLLGKKLTRNIPGTMFKFDFSKWPGKQNNNEMQKATVAELIERSGQNASAENNASHIDLYAEEMAKQLEQIFGRPQVPPKSFFNPRLANIKDALQGLKEVAAKEILPLDAFNMEFTTLASLDVNCCFKLCNLKETEPSNIANRLSFHLFHIHRVECPFKLKEDMEYGKKALLELGEGYSATYEQRIRVLQRTSAEVALAGLEEAIENDDMECTQLFVDDLLLSLHPLDAVNDANNVAYQLFGHLYRIYQTAYAENSGFIDPHNEVFKYDFGRYGFSHPDVHPQFKKQAIYLLLKEMQEKWQIPS